MSYQFAVDEAHHIRVADVALEDETAAEAAIELIIAVQFPRIEIVELPDEFTHCAFREATFQQGHSIR